MEPIFTIVYEPSEEGGFMAVIPQVQGAISQGATMEEARSMVIEAMTEIMAWRREQAIFPQPEVAHFSSWPCNGYNLLATAISLDRRMVIRNAKIVAIANLLIRRCRRNPK